MKRWKVFAERVLIEEVEVEAATEEEAFEKALISPLWEVTGSEEWHITSANLVREA